MSRTYVEVKLKRVIWHTHSSWHLYRNRTSSLAHLIADVTLVRTIPTLTSLGNKQLSTPAGSFKDQPSSSSVVVAEGIPPVPIKILEKVCKWEYSKIH